MVQALLRNVLTNPAVLAGWAALVAVTLAIVVYDLRTNNAEIAPLMQFVWVLSVLYAGPLGLALYAYAGRTQISQDSLWRRAGRSVAHCFSGCGLGEVVGIVLAAGLLRLSTLGVAVTTFIFAYTAGFALTVGPLMQEGVGFTEAVMDALYSETPSITVMEVAAIGTDIWVAGEAYITEPLFWAGLVFSLSVGLVVAYPVNAFLVHRGVKDGMQDPVAMAG
ncbi:DUF4396 domain-containing protein [Haloarchaeobius sp. DYHT-AS-18]|uniref:DUF4396 domain-containing protein n=1 Tax=Haloarchaeobius sp. DYHT-AS-18 TaxID=3446117 RepID=UPI003EBBD1E5